MPTIVGILTFMSMINFILSWAEHDKSYTLDTWFQACPIVHFLWKEKSFNFHIKQIDDFFDTTGKQL